MKRLTGLNDTFKIVELKTDDALEFEGKHVKNEIEMNVPLGYLIQEVHSILCAVLFVHCMVIRTNQMYGQQNKEILIFREGRLLNMKLPLVI